MKSSLLTAVFLMISFLHVSCISEKPELHEAVKEEKIIIHYRLNNNPESSSDEWFEPVESLPQEGKSTPVPWPGQKRISDIIWHDDSIFIGVNRKGIAQINIEDFFSGLKNIRTISAAEIFKNTTLGNFHYIDNRIISHVYKDLFFSDVSDNSENKREYPESPLLKINIRSATAEIFTKFIQIGSVPVNAVELVGSDRMWYTANKHISGGKVIFNYYRYDFYGENAQIITETDFLDIAGNNSAGAAMPEAFEKFASYLNKREVDEKTIIEIKIFDRISGREEIYRVSGKDKDALRYEEIYADISSNGDTFFAYGRKIYRIDNSGRLSVFENIELPDNYRYVKIGCLDKYLYAVWEYRQFYKTGDSGFSIINLEKIDNLSL